MARRLRPGIPIERDHAFRSKRPPVPKAARVWLSASGIGSGFLGCVKNGARRSDLSHAVSLECDALGLVDEPTEDGDGDGRVGDDLVPIFDRHLNGDDGRPLVAIIDTSRRSRRCSPVSRTRPQSSRMSKSTLYSVQFYWDDIPARPAKALARAARGGIGTSGSWES